MRIWHWMVVVAVVALFMAAPGLGPFAAAFGIVLIPAVTFCALVLAQAQAVGSAIPALERALRPRKGPAGLAVLAIAAVLHVVVPAVVVVVAALGTWVVVLALIRMITRGLV